MGGGDELERFRARHLALRAELARRVNAALDRGTRSDLDALVALLEGDLLAQARAEQEHLYPLVDALVRDHGRATATMEIDHEFIAAAVSRIGGAVERMRVTTDRQERMASRTALREALLRLAALVEAHLEKEERVYLPLVERHASADRRAALDASLTAESSTAGDMDVRTIPQRERHHRVLERFAALGIGGWFVLLSDHDPRPLSYQFAQRHAGAYAWEYLERGPLWRVRIRRTAAG